MSVESNDSSSSDDDYLPPKYPSSGRFQKIKKNFNISINDLQEAGPSTENYPDKGVDICDTTKFQCDICSRILKNYRGLQIHRSRIHGSTQSNQSKSQTQPQFSTNASTTASIKGNQSDIDQNQKSQDRTKPVEDLIGKLSTLKTSKAVIKRIPKGARSVAASKMARLIDKCTSANSFSSWEDLLLFPYTALQLPKRTSRDNLTKLVKQNCLDSERLQIPDLQKHQRKVTPLHRKVE